MAIGNAEISELFDRYADLLEIQDANPFRVRAYRNAARVVGGSSRSMSELVAEGRDLDELPGIGKDLAAKIETVVRTGALPQLAQLETRVPRALADLMKLPGLGPKRVKLIYRDLGIRSFEDLKRAIRSGALQALPGFGAKTVARILAGMERQGTTPQRFKLADAEQVAAPLLAYLHAIEGIKTATIAGSFRRRRDTVGDLDVVVTAGHGTPVMERFDDGATPWVIWTSSSPPGTARRSWSGSLVTTRWQKCCRKAARARRCDCATECRWTCDWCRK